LAEEEPQMAEQVLPIGIAVWLAAATLLVVLARTAAKGEALQSRLFGEWRARPGAGLGKSETGARATAGRRMVTVAGAGEGTSAHHPETGSG
jgi:hypothetical protein